MTIYLPAVQYYNFTSFEPVEGKGENITLDNVPFTDIPVHILGGSIVPLRSQSGNTTRANREQNFTVLIAPDAAGSAQGYLRLDDGISLESSTESDIFMTFSNGTLIFDGTFGFEGATAIDKMVFLGQSEARNLTVGDGTRIPSTFDNATSTIRAEGLNVPLIAPFSVALSDAQMQ